MSKSHRDNHSARVKRGPSAFAKKARRRAPPVWLSVTSVALMLAQN